jgi:hypothetical protein
VNRRLLVFAACLLLPGIASARLGETLGQLKERFGRPEPQTQKNVALWFFEAEDGRLAYSVTFDAHGHSIAEGIKPVKRARLTEEMAEEFIRAQLAVFGDSKTARTLKPGERFVFAGQQFTVGENEQTILDEPRGYLIVWIRGLAPSIMVVTPAALQ